MKAQERQREIYLNGMSGIEPLVPSHFRQLEGRAHEVMGAKAFAYIAGGAGEEQTMEANRQAFHQWQVVPRMLRDVSRCDTGITLFGDRLPAPVLLAPIGVLELAHPDGDLAVAKGASAQGLPVIFSNQASFPMEECAAKMGDTPRWFQLYWSQSDELVVSFLKRAEACGCSAIVVTLDTTLLGWRPRDLDLAYLPFLEGKGIAQYTSDPVFQRLVDEAPDEGDAGTSNNRSLTTLRKGLRLMRRYPGNFWENLQSKRPLKAVRTFTRIYSRPSITWEDLSFLRKHTSLPILLKGILHPDDARRALDMGADGVIISNHGGRQVDGAIGALSALPGVADALQGRIPILLDSGVRHGADIFKALALGASAICLGRPYVYGLALAGARGVEAVLKNYMAELELTMALAGCRSVEEIREACLIKK